MPMAAQAVYAPGGNGEEVSGDVAGNTSLRWHLSCILKNGQYLIKLIKWLGVGSEYEKRAMCIRLGSVNPSGLQGR